MNLLLTSVLHHLCMIKSSHSPLSVKVAISLASNMAGNPWTHLLFQPVVRLDGSEIPELWQVWIPFVQYIIIQHYLLAKCSDYYLKRENRSRSTVQKDCLIDDNCIRQCIIFWHRSTFTHPWQEGSWYWCFVY